MRLLDLFCGSGGAAIGYKRAGFHVVGVDNKPQPNYAGDEFIQAEWWQAAKLTDDFDAIHASPPCQGYSPHVTSRDSQWAGTKGKDEPRLIEAVRWLCKDSGLPFVIENVVGAKDELRGPILLCGTMFGLPIPRHRLFETSWRIDPFSVPRHPACSGVARAYAIERGWDPRDMTVTGKGRNTGTKERWKQVMGWSNDPVTQHGLREAIPPVYTDWLGTTLLDSLKLRAAA